MKMATKNNKTKAQLEDDNADLRHEIRRLVALAHKALGAREPNHQTSCIGLGRKYIEEIVEGKG